MANLTVNPLANIPLIGGFFDNTGQLITDEYGNIQTPNFNPYKPNQYGMVGEYNPNMAQATQIQQNPELQSMQMSNLQKMAGLADTGLSAVDEAGYNKARDIGAETLRGGTQAALQNAQARGQAGTGMEFGLREMAAQQGAKNAQDAALGQASDSARMRALYTQAFGGAAGGLSQQQFGQNAANADILNRFNMANTQAANQGQLRNVDTAQGIANANTQQSNTAQQYNNELLQKQYQDQLDKAKGVASGIASQGAQDASTRNNLTNAGLTVAGGMLGW